MILDDFVIVYILENGLCVELPNRVAIVYVVHPLHSGDLSNISTRKIGESCIVSAAYIFYQI